MIIDYKIENDTVKIGDTIHPLSYYGWNNKSCYYFRNLWDHITVPSDGDIVQVGTALCCSLEILHNKWGDRVYGIDPWNPLNHPLVLEKDIMEVGDKQLAFVHCNAGSFDLTSELRYHSLIWSLKNLVSGGVCLTAGNSEMVDEKLGWKVTELAEQHNCSVFSIPEKIQTITSDFNTEHDCLIIKK